MTPTTAELLADMADWEKCKHFHTEEVQGHGVLDEVEIEARWCWVCGALNTWRRNACDRHYDHRWTPYWTEGRSTPRQTGLMLYHRMHGLKRFLIADYWRLKLYLSPKGSNDATKPRDQTQETQGRSH